MKRWIMLAALSATLGGCTGDTQVLVGDVGDHLTHKVLNSVVGFLFPSDDTDEAPKNAAAEGSDEAPTQGE